MAHLGQAFNPQEVEPAGDMSPVPDGEYPAIITDSDMKQTKNGQGQYLELTHQIIDGPFSGRMCWARLNLVNQNAKAAQIAQQELSAICHATGVMHTIQDSSELHNRPMLIKVVYKEGGNGYGPSNEIKAWKKLEGAAPTPASPAPAPAPAATHAQPAPQPAAAPPPAAQAAPPAGKPVWAQ